LIKNIKKIGVGLLIAQIVSIFIQLVIGRFYSPKELGEYSLAMQIGTIFSIIFFLRREYFIVEIRFKALALTYINSSFLNGLKRLFPVFFLVVFINFVYKKVEIDIFFFSFIFGVLLSYNISLQQILNMQNKFFKSGMSEVIHKLVYFFSLILLSQFTIFNFNGICLSFFIALLGRMIYLLYEQNHLPFSNKIRVAPSIFINQFNNITSKGLTLSKNNAIAAISGLIPMLFVMNKYDTADLGFFTMAETLLSLPITIVGNSISQVLYKYICDNVKLINKTEINKILFILIISSLGFLILYPFGKYIIVFILGDKWGKSIFLIYILVPNYMINYISKPFERNCYILGKPNWHVISALIKLLLVIISIIISMIFNLLFLDYILIFSLLTSLHYLIDFIYNYKLIYVNQK
jgi:O-antigen/teichoic acid export membrane protein